MKVVVSTGSRWRLAVAPALAVLAVALAGCAGGARTVANTAAVFNDQGNRSVPCMVHQQYPPTAAYRGGAQENVEATFRMLHYYTTNGNRPYCDGRAASALDRAWLRRYIADGASATYVARNLPAGAAS